MLFFYSIEFGLKQIIYREPRQHDRAEKAPDGLKALRHESVAYSIHLESSEDIMNLLAMTPYYWHIDPVTKKRVEEMSELQTDVDFSITVYQKLP